MTNTGWDAHIRNLNGSNMSLNLPPQGYYPQQRADMQGPWLNGWTGPPAMYPYPVGIPIMNQGITNVLCFANYLYSYVQFQFISGQELFRDKGHHHVVNHEPLRRHKVSNQESQQCLAVAT